jgi:hypothetical protein
LHAKWSKLENVTGYFEVSSLSKRSSYIIVNSANNKALKNDNNSIGASNVTVINSDVDYIPNDVDTNIVWTYDSSNRYLRRSNSNLSISSNSSSWSYSDNQLTTTSSGFMRTTYYINYNNGFSLSTNSSNVHIYSATKETKEIQVSTWEYK